MCARGFPKAVVAGFVFTLAGLHAAGASADPIGISGTLFGQPRFAAIEQQLQVAFPDFTVAIETLGGPRPGFCFSGCGGRSVSLTQSTSFSGHSVAGPPILSPIDADVTGVLSFTGPTAFVDIGDERGAFAAVGGPVELSGWLRVTQGARVLFDGALTGQGTGNVFYSNRFTGTDARLDGYQYGFTATAVTATPEPASLVLLGTGVGLILRRQRAKRSGRRSAAFDGTDPD